MRIPLRRRRIGVAEEATNDFKSVGTGPRTISAPWTRSRDLSSLVASISVLVCISRNSTNEGENGE
jgi:hypothetical protein